MGAPSFTHNFWRRISFWISRYLFAKIMDAPCEKVCQIFIAALGTLHTAPVSVHRCNACLAGQVRRLWRHFPEGRKESTIVYVTYVRAATADQWKPGTVCLRKVDLTQRGGLGTVACLPGWVTGVRWVTHPARHCSGKLSCERGSVK